MGHGPLRVINEDRVQPGQGFAQHSHQGMEILSWVLEGALQHRDSLGTGVLIRPGEMQRMTAGSGITHSEFNASDKELVHFLQIWIIPAQVGLQPGYEQKSFSNEVNNKLHLVASGDAREGSVLVHQDADVYVARLASGTELSYPFKPGRLGWIQIARGSIKVDGQALERGDGAALDWHKRPAPAGSTPRRPADRPARRSSQAIGR